MEQLYVVFRNQYKPEVVTYTNGNVSITRIPCPPLGFAARYDPNSKACNDKNDKQNEWWRRYLVDNGDDTYSAEDYDVASQKYIYSRISKTEYPTIIDNEELTGFKIVDTVSRMTTSNKLWRILDPRGFELEISTDNLFNLIKSGVIDKSNIIGNCIWNFGKNGVGKAILTRV